MVISAEESIGLVCPGRGQAHQQVEVDDDWQLPVARGLEQWQDPTAGSTVDPIGQTGFGGGGAPGLRL